MVFDKSITKALLAINEGRASFIEQKSFKPFETDKSLMIFIILRL
jgi:hypothetical protein